MTAEPLNTQQIRDLLDYLEAEAMACLHERRDTPPHRDFVTALKQFIAKYRVHVPVFVAPQGAMPHEVKELKAEFELDWRAHSAALETVRPLFDLILGVAAGASQEERSRLARAAFPHAMGVPRPPGEESG